MGDDRCLTEGREKSLLVKVELKNWLKTKAFSAGSHTSLELWVINLHVLFDLESLFK